MRKPKININELLKKNKEELLKDKVLIEKIERRVDEKIISFK
ncbi:hypothetical protein JOC85_000865 [Bacillus mesophilus]|uniref:FbpB family small basic protein n=1 Tax=Bacillus mesophilus TaxID=1808955 RepID=A0A6M0QBN2_9BACI|nr:FbpB family small basic protein [Bacillus mesophilus]MBM7660098.1 hypothetical protein [Bacillus mesophilus]NEY73753.1 FbpB family small basic protein [Bacillus mesophilus]